MRLVHLSAGITSSLLILLASRSQATIIIDNGSEPPNPANVINTLISEAMFVQDSNSGDPTTVEMVDGGQVGDETGERLEGFGSSILLISGGYIADDIFTHDSATLFMTGGLVNSGVHAYGLSALFVSDGTIERRSYC
jgi:hypothetical protein